MLLMLIIVIVISILHRCERTVSRKRISSGVVFGSYLSVLQGDQLGVVGGADDLVVALVGGRSAAGRDVVARQTLTVTDGVVLPGLIGHAVL